MLLAGQAVASRASSSDNNSRGVVRDIYIYIYMYVSMYTQPR